MATGTGCWADQCVIYQGTYDVGSTTLMDTTADGLVLQAGGVYSVILRGFLLGSTHTPTTLTITNTYQENGQGQLTVLDWSTVAYSANTPLFQFFTCMPDGSTDITTVLDVAGVGGTAVVMNISIEIEQLS